MRSDEHLIACYLSSLITYLSLKVCPRGRMGVCVCGSGNTVFCQEAADFIHGIEGRVLYPGFGFWPLASCFYLLSSCGFIAQLLVRPSAQRGRSSFR